MITPKAVPAIKSRTAAVASKMTWKDPEALGKAGNLQIG